MFNSQILILVILYFFGSSFLGGLLLNLAGVPGALIACKSTSNYRRDFFWILGFVIAFLGQSFVTLSWVAGIVYFTKQAAQNKDVWKWLVWSIAFFAACSLQISTEKAARWEEANNDPKQDYRYIMIQKYNPSGTAVRFTWLVCLLGFSVFTFFPNTLNYVLRFLK